MNEPGGRWAWAEVDPSAIEHNVAVVRAAADGAPVWAVVKADGYGHGALVAAGAALRGGAAGLCVALVQEGVQLREAGVSAPVLVFGEQPPAELEAAVRHGLTSTVYSLRQVAALDAVARGAGLVHTVHLKVDSGMHRVGCDPTDAPAIAAAIVSAPGLHLEGVYSHLAVADEPGHPFTARQVAVFDAVLAGLTDAGVRPPLVHLANSAGALAHPVARRSLVRPGIAVYGIDSVMLPMAPRQEAWRRLGTDLPLDGLESTSFEATLGDVPALARKILEGKVRGRAVVSLST